MIRLAASIFFAAATAIAGAGNASAMTIEKIVSPAGIEAWLVREKALPLVTLNYALHGGTTQDETDKAGTANLAADLLDEGAGDLDGKTFHERGLYCAVASGRGELRTPTRNPRGCRAAPGPGEWRHVNTHRYQRLRPHRPGDVPLGP